MPEICSRAAQQRIAALLGDGRKLSANLGRPVVVSLTWDLATPPNPVELFSAAGRVGNTHAFWARPADGFWSVCSGRAADIRGSGKERYRQIAQAQQSITDTALVEGANCPAQGLLFIGGFKFDVEPDAGELWREFPDALMTLPRWLVSQSSSACRATVNLSVNAQSNIDSLCDEIAGQAGALSSPITAPACLASTVVKDERAPAHWRRSVSLALEAIEQGDLAKVVLARTLKVRSDHAMQPVSALSRLVNDYPGCMVFAFRRGSICFLGATPEELVSLQGTDVTSTCLAGSAGRGVDAGEDSMLSSRLLADGKERREHAIVADWMSERLGRLCSKVDRSSDPAVLKLGNVQHLATRFSGCTGRERHVLDFVAALHPTPAVGGLPLEAALKSIRRLEGVDRGWYGGPVGWMNGRNGEFGVAIRSALLNGNEATLYAGAGIVAGSDPDREYEETAMKFGPLLAALGAK